jgi:formylglycine-generating enzyme required for sulfatase activity
MAGNIWEWVHDWYLETYYSTSPYNNPPGPDTGTYKVVRGAGFGLSVSPTPRTALRYADYPSDGDYDRGFRCVVDAAED